jgi:hypothetical protein
MAGKLRALLTEFGWGRMDALARREAPRAMELAPALGARVPA